MELRVSVFEADLVAFTAWWRTGGRRRRAQSTCDEYVRQLRHWMRWQQSQPIEASSTPTLRGVRAYVADLSGRPAWVAYGAVKALKAWSRFLVDDGSADVDALKGLANLEQPETSKTPVATLDEIARLLDTCSGDCLEDARDRAVISLLRCTGMRRGELIQLTWDDIDFREATVHLRNETVKGGKGRTVAFDVATRKALKVYRRRIDSHELSNARDLTSWTQRVWVSRQASSRAAGSRRCWSVALRPLGST